MPDIRIREQESAENALLSVRRWMFSRPWRWLVPAKLQIEVSRALIPHDKREARNAEVLEMLRNRTA